MTDAPDAELLERFARDNSETAFAALVERHLGLVHSVALRHTANPQHAQDITQAVFIILARKAAALNRKTVLPGWLYHTARLTAANFQRAENRRIWREQEAYMQSTLNEADAANAWTQMSPLLDEAMSHLGAGDRDALVLRYFQNKSLPEVGAAMGLAERAAQKRVLRAIEKLRKFFMKHGVELSSASLTGAVSVNSIQAAPVALVKTISTVAIAKGAAASSSTLTLVKGALKIMAWSKAKTAIVTAAVVLLGATSIAPYVWHYHLAPNAWQNRFNATYHLRSGELVRHIAPPYIPERLTYYTNDDPSQAKLIPKGPDLIVFTQDKQGKLHQGGYTFGSKQFPLRMVMQLAFHFKTYEFQGPNNLLNLTVNGDWIFSDYITNRETFFTALEPVLLKATKHHLIFKKQTIEQDVIVIRGNNFITQQGGKIQLYAEKTTDDGYMGYGNLDNFIGAIDQHLGMRLINETEIEPNAPETQHLTWVNHDDSIVPSKGMRRNDWIDKILKNVSDQTGLTFTHEKRPEDVWIISEQK